MGYGNDIRGSGKDNEGATTTTKRGEKLNTKESMILAGVISSAHGIQGCVIIKSFTSPATNILKMNLVNAAKENITVKLVRENSKGQLICRVNNISDRNTAETLKGSQLFYYETSLPELEADEFYVGKLQGLPVVDENLQTLGQIKGILNFGAGDIIEVKFLDRAKTELFPFTKQFFPVISKEYAVLVVNN